MRLRLTLAYDGAGFRGWQSQPGGDAVQDVLQRAMTRLAGGKKISVQGSGRTDAGVHAVGQVAHADVPDARGTARFWQQALNAVLPAQIRVLSCSAASAGFHARYSATGKTYEYLLWNAPILPPHWAGRCWQLRDLDLAALRRTAKVLAGLHDFAGFSANRGAPVADTRRHLRRISIRSDGPLVRIRFEGDGFLYKMVRMLVAAMVRVAQGKATLEDLRARLSGRHGASRREVAPPDGLYLVSVRYAKATQSG
jgi:tRNA pseudouridine38-40 synthase